MIEINSTLPCPNRDHMFYLYNGMDACLTLEIFSKLKTQLDPLTQHTYDFSRTMQAPAMEMMSRGFLIDEMGRQEEIYKQREIITFLEKVLSKFAYAVWDKDLNPKSPKQVSDFFYTSMGIPKVYSIIKGMRKVSTNREALEKISIYIYARPIVNTILALRDAYKTLGVLLTSVDHDSRIRASYNIAGTETGRWSSSENAFGTGTNLQNITEKLRHIFVAEPGKRIAYCDLEQAESRLVGMLIYDLFGDTKYIDACEGGDLHTTVCKMVWKNLVAGSDLKDKKGNIVAPKNSTWTGDKKVDKALAQQNFYREFSYRDMAKRGGHGTNYYGKPRTMARHLKVDTKLIEDFQNAYFAEFPIHKWHEYVAKQLQTTATIVSATGRRRIFFARQTEDSTLRMGIAYDPQGSIGDIMNYGAWKVQRALGCLGTGQVELLAQIHDAIVFQYPEELENELIPKIISLLETEFTIKGRKFKIPAEALCGWNWGKMSDSNPDGIRLFDGKDNRKRIINVDTPLLHRVFR